MKTCVVVSSSCCHSLKEAELAELLESIGSYFAGAVGGAQDGATSCQPNHGQLKGVYE